MTQLRRREALLGFGALAAGAALVGNCSRSLAAPQAAATDDEPQQGAGFYRFKVGDVSCFSIGDGQFKMDPYPLWGENASDEAVTAALRANALAPKQNMMHVNVLMMRVDGKVWLVDTGNGTGGQGMLMRHLATLGVRAEDVEGLVLTHLHGDHFGGLTGNDGQLAFPKATIYLNRIERDFWAGSPDLSNTKLGDDWKKGMVAGAQKTISLLEQSKRLQLVDDGAKLTTGLSVKHTGGHTPGHQTVIVESSGQRFEMLADSVHHHVLSFQQPEWHLMFDYDAKEGAKARRATLERVAGDQSLVMCYHTPWPGVGRVVMMNDAFRWVPSPWEW